MGDSTDSQTSTATLLGFDIGGTSMRVVAGVLAGGSSGGADSGSGGSPLNFDILEQTQQRRAEKADDIVADIVQTIRQFAQKLNLTPSIDAPSFDAVGVGCAGFVQLDGVVMHSPNILSFKDYPLQQELDSRLAGSQLTSRAKVENDAAAAAWAEAKLGVGAGHDSLAFIGFGTGIGGALVIDGQLCRGTHGFGTEPGHMTADINGPPCPCGRIGCWERLASGTALGEYARQAVRANPDSAILSLAGGQVDAIEGEHVSAALQQNDPCAQAVLEQLCDWIAVGLNNVVVLVDPELVVLGGGLSDIGHQFLDCVRRCYDKRYPGNDTRRKLKFELASYGDNAGAVGAALLAAG